MISVTHMVFNQHERRVLECFLSRGNSISGCLLSFLYITSICVCVCVCVSGSQVTEENKAIKGPRVMASLATLETKDQRVYSSLIPQSRLMI